MKLAFYRGNEWYSKVIQWWTKSPYSHVELIVDGKWISSDPTDGVRIWDEAKIENVELFDYIEIDAGMNDTFHWFLGNELGCAYDWKGIVFSQFFNLGVNSNTKWFCSEIITKLLQILLYRDVLDLQPNKVSPGMLYKVLTKA